MTATGRAPLSTERAQVRLADIATPFALIDARVMRRNIVGMQDATASIGASLRPHFKTHRVVEIAQLQLDAGAIGLTVASVAQLAAVQEDLSCPVLVSSPLQVDAAIASELRRASGCGGALAFSIESERSADLLRSDLGPEVSADVMIEVEAGCMRTGVGPPSDCGRLGRAASRLGFRVVGLFSYPGQGYSLGRSAEASEQERAALDCGATSLRRAGFDPEHISAGSTPTMPYARAGVATEYRPGTYIFGDRQQLALGAAQPPQISLTVAATVLALHDDRIVLDAGGKALGRDAPRWLPGYGQLADNPEALITRLYDHHSVVEPYRGPKLRIGDRVAVIPNNANSAMVLPRSVWSTDDGEYAGELTPRADR
jgi:D-serine deaminase-like pyridoxal phosphate-dependent protein